MPRRISEQELISKLWDPDVPMAEILPYFEPDPARSKAFAPEFRMRPSLVERDISVESALGLNLLNRVARFKRQSDFRRDAKRRPADLRLVSDGDSWYLHPLITDTVDHLHKYYLVYSLDGAGDLLEDIADEKQVIENVDRVKARGALLSGGGNDLVGGGSLAKVIKPADASAAPDKHIDNAAFKKELDEVLGHYDTYVSEILAAHPNLQIYFHGYDHAIPVMGGAWLGTPMEGVVPPAKQAAVIAILIDRFNERLADFAKAKGAQVHHVDMRGIVAGRWWDELHPNDEGYGSVADRFSEVIDETLRPTKLVTVELAGSAMKNPEDVTLDDLAPLPEHLLAPAVPAEDPAAFRRRDAELVRSGVATQTFEGAELEEFRLTDTGVTVEVVIGKADFQPARFLYDGAERARAICRLVRGIGGSGTGSLLVGGFIMTNWHVLPNADVARGSVAEFGFEEGGRTIDIPLDPDRFFFANEARDFAIVACDPAPLGNVMPLSLSLTPNRVLESEHVNIVQHPAGRPKEVAFRDNKVTEVFQGAIHYRTDTEPGSSGSPVFNDQWELVALHRAGKEGAFNQAIRIDAIASFLESQLEAEGSEAAPEIRSALSGTSPHLGFFGRAGVIDELRPEVEIPTFRGDGEFADVGFWNIKDYFGNVPQIRIERVAELLGEINMDAIGLIEVSHSAIEKTVRHMNRLGENVGFVFLDAGHSRDLAVIFDRDTTNCSLMKEVSGRHRALIEEKIEGKTVFPREPLIAHVKVAEGDMAGVEFAMIVVHLKSKAGRNGALSARRRAKAAENLRVIADDIRASEGLPVMLGGDYNDVLTNDVLSGLTDAPDFFTLTADDEQDGAATFLSPPHLSVIDHVIVAGDLQFGDIEGDDLGIVRFDRTIADFAEEFSDHTPLVMRLVMRDKPIDRKPEGDAARSEDHVVEIPSDADTVRVSFE